MGLSAVSLAKNIGKEGLTGTFDEMFTAVEQHMGPDGLIIQNAMKNATLANQDLNTEMAKLPPQLQTLAQGLVNGTQTFLTYRTAIRNLPEALTNLGTQFEGTYNKAHSFNQSLTTAINNSPTLTGELKTMTGQSDVLQAILWLDRCPRCYSS